MKVVAKSSGEKRTKRKQRGGGIWRDKGVREIRGDEEDEGKRREGKKRM